MSVNRSVSGSEQFLLTPSSGVCRWEDSRIETKVKVEGVEEIHKP